jgi:hypothetical protein
MERYGRMGELDRKFDIEYRQQRRSPPPEIPVRM